MNEEIALTKLDIKENQLLINKYERKILKEKSKNTQLYKSIEDIEVAYENDEIDMEERDSFIDQLEGKAISINEKFLKYLKEVRKNLAIDLKYLEKDEEELLRQIKEE